MGLYSDVSSIAKCGGRISSLARPESSIMAIKSVAVRALNIYTRVYMAINIWNNLDVCECGG